MRVDEVEVKPTEKQLTNEARVLPFSLARRLGDISSFLLAG